MAKSVCNVTLLGNVGKDPEIRATAGGTVVADFSVATSWGKKVDEKWEDQTEWTNVYALGKTAEIVRDYVKKGDKIYLEGTLRTESWEDKRSGEKKYRTRVLINDLTLLGSKPNGSAKPGNQSSLADSEDEFENDALSF